MVYVLSEVLEAVAPAALRMRGAEEPVGRYPASARFLGALLGRRPEPGALRPLYLRDGSASLR